MVEKFTGNTRQALGNMIDAVGALMIRESSAHIFPTKSTFWPELDAESSTLLFEDSAPFSPTGEPTYFYVNPEGTLAQLQKTLAGLFNAVV